MYFTVKDILAHLTAWEEEALKYLPLIITGGEPPRYIQYGGIDAFNAQMTEQQRDLVLSDVLAHLDETSPQRVLCKVSRSKCITCGHCS